MGTFLLTYWFEVVLFVLAAVPSIILFAIKGRISHWFAKDLKTYEQKLDAKNREIQNILDTRLEQMRIEYGTLYQRRTKMIESMYKYIITLQNLVNSYPENEYANSQEEFDYCNEFYTRIMDVSKTLSNLIDISLIYFSENDATALIKLQEKTSAIIQNNAISIDEDNHGEPESQTAYFLSQNKEIFKSVSTKELLVNIISTFRELIGVKEGK